MSKIRSAQPPVDGLDVSTSVAKSSDSSRESIFTYGTALVAARSLPVIAIFVASLRLDGGDFGAAAVIIGAITTAALLADSGTDAGATYVASRSNDPEHFRRTIGALVFTKLVLSGTAVLSLMATQISLIGVSAKESAVLVVLALVGALFSARNSAHRISLRITGSGERPSLVLEKISFSLVFLVWAFLGPPTAYSIVLGYIVASVVGPLAAYRMTSRREYLTSRSDVTALLLQCAPFMLTAICAAVIWRTATFALGQSGDIAQAGYFTLAYYPIQLISSIPVLSAPLLLVSGKYNKVHRKQAVRISVKYGSASSAALIATAFVGHLLVPSSIVAEGVWPTFAVLGLSVTLLWINPILVASMRVEESAWKPTSAHVVGLLVSLPLMFLLIPSLGALGASLAILVGEAVVFSVLTVMGLMNAKKSHASRSSGLLLILLLSSVATFALASYAVTANTRAQWVLSAIVVVFAILTDRKYIELPFILRPGLAVVLAAVISAAFATNVEGDTYEKYLALWSLQMIGFSLGLFVYTSPEKLSKSIDRLEINVGSVAKAAKVVLAVSTAAILLFVAAKGIPALGSDIEQGRVDSAGAGTGYLRLAAYMAVPSALLLVAVRDRLAWVGFLIALSVVLALGNRSPLLYLIMPIALLYFMTFGNRRSSLKIVAAILLLGLLVSAFGTYRIASQADFVKYAEYRQDLLEEDYVGIAITSVRQYAEVVADNAVLTKDLVDSGEIPYSFGSTYFTLFVTALPGEQLSLDRVIKEASGKSFIGGGTPPTFMGEGYVNFGPIGTVLMSAGLVIAARFLGGLARRPRSVGAGSLGSRLYIILYGYAITWFMICQVGGLAGASTVPLAGFLVLVGIITVNQRVASAFSGKVYS